MGKHTKAQLFRTKFNIQKVGLFFCTSRELGKPNLSMGSTQKPNFSVQNITYKKLGFFLYVIAMTILRRVFSFF